MQPVRYVRKVWNRVSVVFLISEFDQIIWHCQDLDFHSDLQVSFSEKKNAEHLYNSVRSLGVLACPKRERIVSQECDQRQDQMQTRRRPQQVESLWQHPEIVLWQQAWQMVSAAPCIIIHRPALFCEHRWTDCEVLQALNPVRLLITAPWKKAHTQNIMKLIVSLVWEVRTRNKRGGKGRYACHFVSQPVISHYNSQHMLAMNISAILEIRYWRVFSWTKNCQISLAQPVHLLWFGFVVFWGFFKK